MTSRALHVIVSKMGHCCFQARGIRDWYARLDIDSITILLGVGVACTPITDLEHLIVCHVSSQSCEGLSTATSHTHQEGVASRLLDNAADATHMLNSKPGMMK